MNISLICTALALCLNNPAQCANTADFSEPSGTYSFIDIPDPSPLIEEKLKSDIHFFEQRKDTTTLKNPQSIITQQTYVFPAQTRGKVIRSFAPPSVRWGTGHRGVDVALEVGSDVLAAGDGVVIYAGKLNDRSVISIEHADGIRTTYEPVSPSVSKGDTVKAGQVIGTLDSGHCPHQSCLHWGAKRSKDTYIDPLSLLRERQIRLIE